MMYRSFEDCTSVLGDVIEIDYYLARTLCAESGQSDNDLLFHLVLALSVFLRQGHSCLPLAVIANEQCFASPDADPQTDGLPVPAGYRFPDIDSLRAGLSSVDLSPGAGRGLVLDNGRLYIRRYWLYEQEVSAAINQRRGDKPLTDGQMEKLAGLLTACYDDPAISADSSEADEVNWSKVAVANSLIRNFSILTGGPGTGKTYTATRLLLALQELHDGQLTISLAAPTGKAAQRLNESITLGKARLAAQGIPDEKLNRIPGDAKTLHRLLGFRPQAVRPGYDADRLLPCDVLLVDEASMIDLPMLTRLFRAIKPDAILIMLGDPNQLPSVEVGSVLAELTRGEQNRFSPSAASTIARLTGEKRLKVQDNVSDHTVTLTKSWRFAGAVGELATAVVNGDGLRGWQLLEGRADTKRNHAAKATEPGEDSRLSLIEDANLTEWFEGFVKEQVSAVSHAVDLADAFSAFARFRLLTPHRVGARGVEALNARVETLLAKSNSAIDPGRHYMGRPIMVTENDYSARLFNGDIGLVWRNSQGRLVACFEEGKDEAGHTLFREISLVRLPRVETVYVMTIHKTQGSEFDHVAIVLPEHDS